MPHRFSVANSTKITKRAELSLPFRSGQSENVCPDVVQMPLLVLNPRAKNRKSTESSSHAQNRPCPTVESGLAGPCIQEFYKRYKVQKYRCKSVISQS